METERLIIRCVKEAEIEVDQWLMIQMKDKFNKLKIDHIYCLQEKSTGHDIGLVYVYCDTLRCGTNTKEIYYWLKDKYINQGYMTEALQKIIYYLFHEEALWGITVRYCMNNEANSKLLKKLGFKKEGILKNAILCSNGISYDETLYYLENKNINYVYMLRCKKGQLYTGWTNNLKKRIEKHNSKNGAKYTKTFGPCELVYYETFLSKEQAMKREYEIKQLKKADKERLINEKL